MLRPPAMLWDGESELEVRERNETCSIRFERLQNRSASRVPSVLHTRMDAVMM